MKVVLFVSNEWPHKKNIDAIQRMCKVCNIEFEISNDKERIKQNNYNILLTCNVYIDPYSIPHTIKIMYGPHFFILPEGQVVGKMQNELVGRCVYNSLSEWVATLYYECVPSFIMPVVPLPFGVNTNVFKPYDMTYEKSFDCIVYIKRRSTALIDYTMHLLNSKNIKYHVFEYGKYKEEDYMYGIRMSKFMLVLDAHESQGFALEEAMSCNVPLLVLDATTMYEETNDGIHATYDTLQPKRLYATSVPYWSEECGLKITEQYELSDTIDRMMATYKTFTPREYVLRTLSDEVCMKRILDYFQLQ